MRKHLLTAPHGVTHGTSPVPRSAPATADGIIGDDKGANNPRKSARFLLSLADRAD